MTGPVQPLKARTAPATPVDEARDFDIGAVDIVLGVLTMPLLFWVLMFAVTGAEQVVATRSARMRLYVILLATELAIVAAIVLMVLR